MFWAFKVTYGAHWHGVLLFVREWPVVPEAEELQRRIQVASTEER